uniref:beta strand repeat-containing protein n=1 Tax=Desulfovibrio sp. ZJ369 TaxID=2709793 RepID=UPI0013EB2E41
MQMTQGALGFLIKRYSAVLKKCRMLNLLGSLALAGALTVGAAGLAVAADPAPAEDPAPATPSYSAPWNNPGTVTLGTGAIDTEVRGGANPLTQNQERYYGKNVNTTILKINDGGKLTLENGDRVVHYYNPPLPSNVPAPTPAINGMTVDMTGGTVTITTGSVESPALSSMDVDKFNISGGQVTLTGNTGNAWTKAAYIGAYNGMTIGGTAKINMGVNSELFAGDYLRIEGGTITMEGEITESDAKNGFGNNAAHIMFTSGENTISGGTITVSATKRGVMTAPTLNMTGGILNVEANAKLLLQPNEGEGSVVYFDNDDDTGKSGVFNLSGDSTQVNVAENGAFFAPYTQINQDGGKLTVKGALWTQPINYEGDFFRSGYHLSKGELEIEGNGSPDGLSNGTLQTGMLKISGGEVTIKGTQGATKTPWVNGPYLLGTHGADISGGTVTLNGPVHIAAGAKTNETSQFNISGNAQILMTGHNPLIRASNRRVSLNIKDTASITVGTAGTPSTPTTGYIVSRMTNMSGGTITVNSGSTLIVAGGAKKGATGATYDVADGIANMTDQGGDFNLSGGKITVASTGNLDFVTGKVNVIQTGGELNYTAGDSNKLAFHGLTVAGGTRTGMDNLTVEAEGTVFGSRVPGVSASTLTVGASDKAGDLGLTKLTQTGGKVNVNNGTLTVVTLDQHTGGLITVGGAGAVGTLKVTGEEADSLKNVAYTTTAGIKVDNQGTLEAHRKALLNDALDSLRNAGTQHQIEVAAGGTLKVNGLTSDNEFTKAEADALKGAIMSGDSKGILDLGEATVKLATNDDDGTVKLTEMAGTTSTALKDASASGTADELKAATGAVKDVTVTSGVPAGNEVTVGTGGGSLQLVGSSTEESAPLVKNTENEALNLNVANNAALTLGDAGKTNKGTVGDVELGNGSALDVKGVEGAAFTTGKIEGASGAVDVAGASLASTDLINVGTVDVANGGAVTAAKDITAATTTLNNGTIKSETGKVTLTNGVSNASGAITARGDITTTAANASITAANDGELDLNAGGNISTGNNGSISATTVTAGGNITAAGTGSITAANVSAGKSINADTGSIAAANVSAGENITATNVTATGNVVATGDITATNVTAASVQANKLDASGAVTVTGGSLNLTGTDASEVNSLALNNAQGSTVGDLTVATTVTLTDGTDLTAGTLTMTAAAPGSPTNNLTVGSANDERGGTTLVVEKLKLAGNSLLLDPAWGKDSTRVAVIFEPTVPTDPDVSIIDGNVGVGMNSMAAIGTTNKDWLTGHVNAVTNGNGLSRDGVDSALGIFTPHQLDSTKSIQVNGTKAPSATPAVNFDFENNTLKFSPNSLLVVNAEAALDPAGALSAEDFTTATIEDGAKLRIAGAEVGQKYKVLGTNINTETGGTVHLTDGGWSGANFSTDSPMVGTGVFDPATGTITPTLESAHKVFPSLDSELADLVDAGYLAHEIGTDDKYVNAADKGARFLSRATSTDYLGNNTEQAAVTIESAARMALLGAVPQMTLAANNAAGNAVTQRTSLAQPGGNAIQSMASDGSVSGASATEVAKSGFALWIMPLYQSANGWGLEGGNFNMDYSGGLGGVAIGADYTFENAIRAGITFNIGGGYATGSGDFNETTNDMSFWGIGAYAGWTKNNFGLTADVNYTSTYNKLEQELPAAMQMDSLKSDVTAWAISAGLRGEYKFETSVLDIIP